MAIRKENELVLDYSFDSRKCRHTLNGHPVVMHCHHYLDLFSQLADDVEMLDGAKLMADVAENAFVDVFQDYFQEYKTETVEARIGIMEQMYSAFGLGSMNVLCAGSDSGEVELTSSHVDEGWIKKWGKRDKPVNFVTWGYIAALFDTAFDCPVRTYRVSETASIVSGDSVSRFEVVAV